MSDFVLILLIAILCVVVYTYVARLITVLNKEHYN